MSDDDSLTLSRDATHDLKNQLGIVIGFIDLLLEDTPESDPRHPDLIEVREAARACLAIVARTGR